MKIFVINMDNATKRLAFQQKQMKKLGLEFERIPAVPISGLQEDFIKHCKKTWLVDYDIELFQIALLLSHKNVWQKILQANEPALVLEDDAVLIDDVPQILLQLENKKTFADYINLEGTLEMNLIGKKAFPLYKNYNLLRNYRQKAFTAAYILYPKGANIFLKAFKNYTDPSDHYINSPLINISRWIVEPTPIYQGINFLSPFTYGVSKESIKSLDSLKELPDFLKRQYRRRLARLNEKMIRLCNLFNAQKRRVHMQKEAALDTVLKEGVIARAYALWREMF